MTARRARANGEGSIFPYRNGVAAYAWVTKPDGKRTRKYVYGKTREDVHDKWLKLLQQAKLGPVATSTPTLGGVPGVLAQRGHRAQPRAVDLRHLRQFRPLVHRSRPRDEAARPTPVTRCPNLDQHHRPHLPVLRPGQGRGASGG